MRHLSVKLQQNFLFKTSPKNEREYWIEEIWKEVRIKFHNISYNKVYWRIQKNLVPCNTQAVKDFYFRLLHERKDPRSPYKNYAHAFFARTKTKLDN